MHNINDITIKYMHHYALELNNVKVQEILEKKHVNSDEDAREIMQFLERLSGQIKVDVAAKKTIFRNTVTLDDGVDICDNMELYLENLGYEEIVEKYRPESSID